MATSQPIEWVKYHMAQMGFVLSSAFQGDYEAHGIGSILLHKYLAKNQALPDDDQKLARLVGCTIEQWEKVSDRVRVLFYRGEDGLLHQEELDAMLNDAVTFLTTQRSRGGSGGRAKAEAHKVLPFKAKEQ